MEHCCHDDEILEKKNLSHLQCSTLKTVFWVHVVMCLITLAGGVHAASTALLADGVDLFGHAVLIGLSIYATHRGPRWLASASLAKGAAMGIVGFTVLFDAAHHLRTGGAPDAHTMGVIEILGIFSNLLSLLLMKRHRADDINMRSTWLCTRNDLIRHSSILLTSGLIAVTGSRWPDTAMGIALAALILSSSSHVIRHSWAILEMEKKIP